MPALWKKNPKMDTSKRSNNGHLKYFRRVKVCPAQVSQVNAGGLKTRKIDEFYGPVEKRQRTESDKNPIEIITIPESDLNISNPGGPDDVHGVVENISTRNGRILINLALLDGHVTKISIDFVIQDIQYFSDESKYLCALHLHLKTLNEIRQIIKLTL